MQLKRFWRRLPRATKATLLRIPVGLLACLLVLLVARGILTLSWYLVLPLVGMHALNGWTDFMDGRWAREDENTGPIGEALDHIADKLGNDATFVACALAGWVPGEIACLLVFRDFLSSGLREGRYAVNELGNGGTKRSLSGAVKTWGVFLLLGAAPLNAIVEQAWSQTIFNIMLLAFTLVLLWSTYTYFTRHAPAIAPHMLRPISTSRPMGHAAKQEATSTTATTHKQ
ncbi:MAG: CDP-alcohol phosphatidyltransferase family protein [Candidatus Doudnabacteria bacterium]|nr:CDP-alcohol phosphatidyltransferase family protein [Candidatus Doudnabacteria bacterium]